MMENGNKDDGDVLRLTPSADGILDVTPVPTEDEEDEEEEFATPTGMKAGRSTHNENAFSSSSEEDSSSSNEEFRTDEEEESHDHEEDESDGDSQVSSPQGYNASEWDKALMMGKPSKGHASDFFAAPSYSHDSSDFVSNAVEEVVREASTHGDDSFDESSLPPSTPARSAVSLPLPRQGLPPPPPPPSTASVRSGQSMTSGISSTARSGTTQTRPSINSTASVSTVPTMRPHPADDNHLNAGVLPDVLMTMRQKIESLTLFDSDMMRLANEQVDDDPGSQETRESLKRSSQQSISASVLVSLAHKRYERRRLAAMEIEKVVRSLVHQKEIDRVRAILLLLSDDYVRSTSEDARKGGVVALAAGAIGLKKADDEDAAVQECRDLILASVVHACQDHSQRVRYYATESLFNVVKVIPTLAVQHFFILFEILRSLYADVDVDVRSGAELLDKKLKEVIVSAINSGTFSAEACVPVFARFVHMRNKATNRLTLTWLQELNEKLIGAPILEFLHLFLGGIFDMVADPNLAIRQSALAFLQSVLPKLLVLNSEAIDDMDDRGMKVDFDKILQSLVTTMEHPDPFVRKVAMYWMSRIVKAHMSPPETDKLSSPANGDEGVVAEESNDEKKESPPLSAASVSVRNSLPHVLPGLFLSIGDSFNSSGSTKDTFLPDQTTRSLAEQTNACLQDAVRRDGKAYVQHLDGFIVALREELDSPGGLSARNPPAIERTPYRMDVKQDGTGIESPGWFRASSDMKQRNDDSMVMSRLCALHWVIVLYESVVPDILKADYAREFVFAIIHQLVDDLPKTIVYKSLEVLAKITIPVSGEDPSRSLSSNSLSGIANPAWASAGGGTLNESLVFPMTDSHVAYALDILDSKRRTLMSRNREVFEALIQLHSYNERLLADLSSVITYMCKLQPPEFVLVSFSVELDRFVRTRQPSTKEPDQSRNGSEERIDRFARDLKFVSSFVQHISHVILNAEEAQEVREVLKDCIGSKGDSERDRRRSRLFHILLHSFSHNLAATLSLCLWAGAYKTASTFLNKINPLDINLMFLLEIDRLIELLERPLFRHLHIRMLEPDKETTSEGSGTMLFQTLKSLLMIIPQSTCYSVLKDRLISASRFRQSTIAVVPRKVYQMPTKLTGDTELYVTRVLKVRGLHCAARWKTIRAGSLETPKRDMEEVDDEGADRREWLGYGSKEEEHAVQQKYRDEKKLRNSGFSIEEVKNDYQDLESMTDESSKLTKYSSNEAQDSKSSSADTKETSKTEGTWKNYWANAD